jgi:hypothetical protein
VPLASVFARPLICCRHSTAPIGRQYSKITAAVGRHSAADYRRFFPKIDVLDLFPEPFYLRWFCQGYLSRYLSR